MRRRIESRSKEALPLGTSAHRRPLREGDAQQIRRHDLEGFDRRDGTLPIASRQPRYPHVAHFIDLCTPRGRFDRLA